MTRGTFVNDGSSGADWPSFEAGSTYYNYGDGMNVWDSSGNLTDSIDFGPYGHLNPFFNTMDAFLFDYLQKHGYSTSDLEDAYTDDDFWMLLYRFNGQCSRHVIKW